MKRHFAIFNSDQVSKDGTQFSIAALEDGVWQSSIYGIPSNMSHDLHKPIGWAYAKGLYFDFQKTLTVGYFLIGESDADFENINNARRSFFLNMLTKSIEPHQKDFIEELDETFDESIGKFFYNNLVLYNQSDVLFKFYPKLAQQVENDKDNLIDIEVLLADFEYLGYGIFKDRSSNKTVLAHPYFRKSLSHYNNFHSMFLDELVRLSEEEGLKAKIKLDPDFIGFSPSFLQSFEFEYWWGPKYDDNISSIQPGLTVHKSDEFERLYYNIDRTEFFWKANNELHEFELEEVKDEPAPTLNDTYACRYIHSIYNKDKKEFQHFDGAIRAYSTDLMIERLDSKMTEFGRRSNYTKLFRVDGKLSLDRWKSLVTNYLQGNPQIYEYFNLPKPAVKQIPNHEEEKTPLEKYIPYSISKDDGIRMLVSYHAKKDHGDRTRYVSIPDVIHLEDGQHDAIEYFTIEVKKALNRIGEDLEMPNRCKYMCPEDYYINIPCIYHSSSNTQQLVNKTAEALKMVVESLFKKNNEEVLSFTFAWNVEDKELRISTVGHVSDLNNWFSHCGIIPTEREAFKTWLKQQQEFCSKNGMATSTPVLSEVIQSDGVLYFKRRVTQLDVDMEIIKGKKLKFEVQADESKNDLIESLSNKQIFIAPSMIIEEMICSKSGRNYFESPYSIVLDDGVGQYMKKFKPATFHWTDKPRPINFQ
tara:strand:- start:1812 stop:3911 length:2100 start_codon:yes stop_codon:yes gene_type:complete